MSEKIKINVLKNGIVVPIGIGSEFYYSAHAAAMALLDTTPDPKQAIINIENAGKDPVNNKLTTIEHGLLVLMHLINEVETVALSDKDKYISVIEKDVDPEN